MSIKISFKDKAELVEYVDDKLGRSSRDSVLTMTIRAGLSEDSYVLTVTEELWADIVRKQVQASSLQPTNTSSDSTANG